MVQRWESAGLCLPTGLQPNSMLPQSSALHSSATECGGWLGRGWEIWGGVLIFFRMSKLITYNTDQWHKGEIGACVSKSFYFFPVSFLTFLCCHNFPVWAFNKIFWETRRSKIWGNICQYHLAHFPPTHTCKPAICSLTAKKFFYCMFFHYYLSPLYSTPPIIPTRLSMPMSPFSFFPIPFTP